MLIIGNDRLILSESTDSANSYELYKVERKRKRSDGTSPMQKLGSLKKLSVKTGPPEGALGDVGAKLRERRLEDDQRKRDHRAIIIDDSIKDPRKLKNLSAAAVQRSSSLTRTGSSPGSMTRSPSVGASANAMNRNAGRHSSPRPNFLSIKAAKHTQSPSRAESPFSHTTHPKVRPHLHSGEPERHAATNGISEHHEPKSHDATVDDSVTRNRKNSDAKLDDATAQDASAKQAKPNEVEATETMVSEAQSSTLNDSVMMSSGVEAKTGEGVPRSLDGVDSGTAMTNDTVAALGEKSIGHRDEPSGDPLQKRSTQQQCADGRVPGSSRSFTASSSSRSSSPSDDTESLILQQRIIQLLAPGPLARRALVKQLSPSSLDSEDDFRISPVPEPVILRALNHVAHAPASLQVLPIKGKGKAVEYKGPVNRRHAPADNSHLNASHSSAPATVFALLPKVLINDVEMDWPGWDQETKKLVAFRIEDELGEQGVHVGTDEWRETYSRIWKSVGEPTQEERARYEHKKAKAKMILEEGENVSELSESETRGRRSTHSGTATTSKHERTFSSDEHSKISRVQQANQAASSPHLSAKARLAAGELPVSDAARGRTENKLLKTESESRSPSKHSQRDRMLKVSKGRGSTSALRERESWMLRFAERKA